MKILLVADSYFKEYGGPFTAISQEVRFLNKKKIKNKLIFNRTNNYKYTYNC